MEKSGGMFERPLPAFPIIYRLAVYFHVVISHYPRTALRIDTRGMEPCYEIQ
jgi:hypothetical protein